MGAGEREYVAQIGHAAACDDGHVRLACEMAGRLDVSALQQPVAADVGAPVRRDARTVEPAGETDRRNGGALGPAPLGDQPVLRLDRASDASVVAARRNADDGRAW